MLNKTLLWGRCKDISGLMIEFRYEHYSDKQRPFRGSNITSFKAVLLYNGNVKPSIPIAHAVNMKETYEAMKTCLEAINFSKHDWKIWKIKSYVTTCLVTVRYPTSSDITKYMCFLCLCDYPE